MFSSRHGAQPEGGAFFAISVSGKQPSNTTSNLYWPSPAVWRAAGKKTGESPPGRDESAGKKVPRMICMTASDSRLAVPGHGEAAGDSRGGRIFALVARILFWVSLWASVVARTEASPPVVLRGNPLAVRTSWSVSTVLVVGIMAGGIPSASAKRCDTVIPGLPLTTTKIGGNTCDEGESREDDVPVSDHMSRRVIASRLISVSKSADSHLPCFLPANVAAGTMPVEIGKLTSLQDLQLGATSLSGTIQPSVGCRFQFRRSHVHNLNGSITCPGG